MWETAGQMTWFLQQNERKKMREATYKLQGLEEYQSINVWDSGIIFFLPFILQAMVILMWLKD